MGGREIGCFQHRCLRIKHLWREKQQGHLRPGIAIFHMITQPVGGGPQLFPQPIEKELLITIGAFQSTLMRHRHLQPGFE